MKLIMPALIISANVALCDVVELNICVASPEGTPVENATVTVRTRKSKQAPLWAPAEKEIHTFRTDSEGRAHGEFICWSARFNCSVMADGYYAVSLPEQVLEAESEDSFSKRLIEKSRELNVVLWPKLNPLPLYSYKCALRCTVFGTNNWSSCGYDLQMDDWLPPKGNGHVADFFVENDVSMRGDLINRTGTLTFTDGAGAYKIVNIHDSPNWVVYSANTNATFESAFSVHSKNIYHGKVLEDELLLAENECLVLRTRVKKDAEGRIISCHYSKIYGPMELTRKFEFKQSVFNPRSNDSNLELDVSKNLNHKAVGAFRP